MVWQVGGLSLSPCVMPSTFWGAKPYEFFDQTWFTEGFDTADLQEAKALLDVLR